MNMEDAYHILKGCIELDEDTQEAYDAAIFNQNEYRIVVEQFYNETKTTIEMGQSSIVLGELVRQFYNATHREINNKIIDLPGAEFCQKIGKVANVVIQQTIQINTMSEEFAVTQLSCSETVNISYA